MQKTNRKQIKDNKYTILIFKRKDLKSCYYADNKDLLKKLIISENLKFDEYFILTNEQTETQILKEQINTLKNDIKKLNNMTISEFLICELEGNFKENDYKRLKKVTIDKIFLMLQKENIIRND